MANETETPGVSDFRDRKGGLVAFGIIQVLLGLFCLLMVPLMAFSMFAASSFGKGAAAPMSVHMLIPARLFYAALAVWFICMGIGSIEKCSKFWKMDRGQLAAWTKQVESGQIPDFGANLVY